MADQLCQRGPSYGDVAAGPTDGWIWDYAKRAGITLPDLWRIRRYGRGQIESVKGHSAPYSRIQSGRSRTKLRADAWEKRFRFSRGDQCRPALNTLRISDDHTSGLKSGEYSHRSRCRQRPGSSRIIHTCRRARSGKSRSSLFSRRMHRQGRIMWMPSSTCLCSGSILKRTPLSIQCIPLRVVTDDRADLRLANP